MGHVLLTGAASGIGRAAAIALAEDGATLILLDKKLPQLESLYNEIEAVGRMEPTLIHMDLATSQIEDFERLGESLTEHTQGVLDGLLLDAAMLGIMSRIDDYDIQTWHQVIQTNLNATFLTVQACLPLLRRSESANLLLCTDSVGRRPKAYWGAYAASKAGAESLFGVLADELENSRIRVNSFDPGATRTNLRHQAFPAEDTSKLQSPESLAPLLRYLMRADHAWHGQRLETVDVRARINSQ